MVELEKVIRRTQKLIDYFEVARGMLLPILDDALVPSPGEMVRDKFLSGMGIREINKKIELLRAGGLLPAARTKNTNLRRSISESYARSGGRSLVLSRYSFMTSFEAHTVLVDRLGQEKADDLGLSEDSIKRGFHHLRIKGKLRYRTPEEEKSTRNAIYESKEVKRGRAKFWNQVMNLAESEGIRYPDNRLIWMDIYGQTKDPEEGFKLIKKLVQERQKFTFILSQVISWQDPINIARKIKEHAEAIDLKGVEAFEAISLQRLKDRGVELPAVLYKLIERVGIETEIILSKKSKHRESEMSNMDYLKYSMYYLILLKRGLNLKADVANMSKEDLSQEIKRLVGDEQTRKFLINWRPIFENLVKNGKA